MFGDEMRTRIARGVAAVTALSTVVLGLAACGGGSSEASSSSTTLSIAWSATPTQLDPNIYTDLSWLYAMDGYMDTLVDYDTSKGSDKQVLGIDALQPALATSYEANADKTAYTFHLREGVMSEYGNELTADDVIWSFERMLSEPTSNQAGVLLPTANVNLEEPWTKIDKYTVRYNLTKPSAVALSILAYPLEGILDSDEAKKHATKDDPWAGEWLADHSASFGAYKLTSLDPGQEVRLSYNENYWGDKPEFTDIIIKAVPDASSRAQLLMSGEVDMISEPPIDQLESINDSGVARVSVQPDTNRHNLSLNTNDPALSKPMVRQAISHAIDRDEIVESVYQGFAEPARSPVTSTLLPEQPETGAYDVDLAKDLLAKAGYPDGFDLTLSYNTGRPGPYAEDMARLIQSDLGDIGIDVSLKSVPSLADFENSVDDGKMQSYLYTERPAIPDVGYSLYLYLHSKSALNNSGYASPAFDRIVVEALGMADSPQRDQLLNDAIGILADDEPIISLVEVPDLVGVSTSLKGYVAIPSGGVKFDDLTRG
jgi:peptide/nickel transport system substrate-binding protein